MPAIGCRRPPRTMDAQVEGGLRAPGRFPGAERVRRCVRIWSITVDRVMNATIRIEPAHCGHTRPCAGLTLLAAAERTTDRRAEQHSSVRSQQKLSFGGLSHRSPTTAPRMEPK